MGFDRSRYSCWFFGSLLIFSSKCCSLFMNFGGGLRVVFDGSRGWWSFIFGRF